MKLGTVRICVRGRGIVTKAVTIPSTDSTHSLFYIIMLYCTVVIDEGTIILQLSGC